MIFYTYLDPDVLSVENVENDFAMQALIGILRGFTQNCFIAEFEDYRLQDAIKEQVNSLPDTFDRKIIKSLLTALKKRNRFIYCLVPDYSGNEDDISCLVEQAAECFLDLLLFSEANKDAEIPDGIEKATLATFQTTNFENVRSNLAINGRTFTNGELDQNDFLNWCFGKMLRYPTRIEICDKLFGSRFSGNFEYTVKTFLRWFEQIIVEPQSCKLIFHCGKPEGHTDHHIKTQLVSFKTGRLENLPMEIQFYQLPDNSQALPHDRYLVTDQIVIDIGRGFDFLDRNTRKNRDLTVGYKSFKEVDNLLKSYASAMLPRILI
ncbi:MAG: hypothetical protein SRB2_01710 [Desulfobacteraceae bacterium Eth-SRB2]|nr:MAG: hypothetical protein SRB2_01710 [Desulfobacteraceae bacterium Eth-SRB2]